MNAKKSISNGQGKRIYSQIIEGIHYVFPVQAKGKRDGLNVVRIEQDFELCAHKYGSLICKPIGAKFMENVDDLRSYQIQLQNE